MGKRTGVPVTAAPTEFTGNNDAKATAGSGIGGD